MNVTTDVKETDVRYTKGITPSNNSYTIENSVLLRAENDHYMSWKLFHLARGTRQYFDLCP